ncbi:class I lanthipeptide [Chitinophaga nivalis]|uniref:Class I lanthipeptide n=1 Tax=Chitinophaga nivalis TaxID=2991709 RepID=A0ABT3IP44_9BACT|nr:class I lanthipeptide [Chitinophaga nivalis]MCW3464749.1 class I lanthipeptide [Chitinophaga nivalis]MCW3485560.1 class I lanthipeptide [Chitinophaga nivalis]
MKSTTSKQIKGLSLDKKTIAKLSDIQMNTIVGGAEEPIVSIKIIIPIKWSRF